MKSSPALVTCKLSINCPYCDSDTVDLLEDDVERTSDLATLLFTDKWEEIIGHEVTCPECGDVFTVGKVEW